MTRKPKQPKLPPGPTFPIVVETFHAPSYETSIQRTPSCFNGLVRIERYRVTIEKIEEPLEVLRDRLVKLWRESERNIHHWNPMHEAAQRILGISATEAKELLRLEENGIDHKGSR